MVREFNLILLQGTRSDFDEVRVADLEAGKGRIDEMLLPIVYGPLHSGQESDGGPSSNPKLVPR